MSRFITTTKQPSVPLVPNHTGARVTVPALPLLPLASPAWFLSVSQHGVSQAVQARPSLRGSLISAGALFRTKSKYSNTYDLRIRYWGLSEGLGRGRVNEGMWVGPEA